MEKGAEGESPRKSLCHEPEELCTSEEVLWRSSGGSMEEPACSSPTAPPPLTSMERCLSCSSQLFQNCPAVDLLKPSWTMDLGVEADRVSLSSYGSSGGEVNYDKPRNTLRKANLPTHADSPQGTWAFTQPHHAHCYGLQRRPPHPYHNYDFPRLCATHPASLWAETGGLDRESVASSLPCSDGTLDWYDTPRKSPQPQEQGYDDGQHNYDFPPAVTERGLSADGVGVSVNGEGKMPLVVGGLSQRLPTNAVYAQVDKSKKTPRPQPLYVNTQHHANNYVNLHFAHSLLIYENGAGVPPPRPPADTAHRTGQALRRSASVPAKARTNRDSSSSEDSGVSGDAGLFSEDGSPLNDVGGLCLHESLPRRGARSSEAATTESASAFIGRFEEEANYSEIPDPPARMPTAFGDRSASPTHYETIPEKGVLGEAKSRSTSSGASDMSDYLDTLSSSSRSSEAALPKAPLHRDAKTRRKPRSGKEYFQIDRTLFAHKD